MNKLYGFGALAVALTASGALAQWVEVGDAGELVGTAQAPVGVGALTTITGAVGGDTDMYLIAINSPSTFSATTTIGTGFDTQLWLFTTTGIGIAFNDDAGPLQSTLPAGNPLYSGLAPGNYLLAVNGYNSNALSAGGAIFPDTFPGVFGPTGPGGGTALTGWSGLGTAGGYTITLTGARFIPGPASLALLGLVGLTGRRRRA